MSNKILLISILIIILSGAGGFYFWWPNLEEYFDSKKALADLEDQLEKKEGYYSQLGKASKELDKYLKELEKIDSALATDPSIPALFYFVKKSISENGLAAEALSLGNISPSKDQMGVKEISFGISISGTYPAFKNFLSSIYKNSRIIEVKSISFSSPSSEEEEKTSQLFDFSVSLATYSYLGNREIQSEQR